MAVEELLRFVVFRCVVGSQAFGLSGPESDVDRRGFYLPPTERHWSLAGVPEQLETGQEECYWEVEKFIRMALKANPNVLECLYTPLVETCSAEAEAIVRGRGIFLSRQVYRTYHSYVLSQFKKMERDLANRGGVRWKHVMHLMRLLVSGITVLREGFVPVQMDRYRERLLAIRAGVMPWEEVERWRLELHGELDAAAAVTKLPENPDYAAADRMLVEVRRAAACVGYGA